MKYVRSVFYRVSAFVSGRNLLFGAYLCLSLVNFLLISVIEDFNAHAFAEATWSTWTSWGVCSETCDAGIRTRQRSCQNPAPGQTCPGEPTDSQSCFIQECIGKSYNMNL